MFSPNAEWTNEQVLEFIELYRAEEALWNPANKYHKNKNVLADSWERIRKKMCVEDMTVADLKKKKEILMTTYRYHLKKYKNSLKSGASADEIYQTNWFAYQSLDSFLEQNYDCKRTIDTENRQESSETSTNVPETQQPQPKQQRQEATGQQEQQTRRKIHNKNFAVPNLELQQIKKQMDNAYEVMTVAAKRQEFDETDYFCHMLAKKLKKMNENDRDKLMYDIHALTYQTTYSSRPSTALSSTSSNTTYNGQVQTPSPYYQIDTNDYVEPSLNQYVYDYGASTSTSNTSISTPNNQSSIRSKNSKRITLLSQDIIQQAYESAETDGTQDILEEKEEEEEN